MKCLFAAMKNLFGGVMFLSFFMLAVLTAGPTIFSSPASAQVVQKSLGNSRGQYFVEFNANGLPNDLSARIAALGGTVVDTMPQLNMAIVENLSDAAASALRAQTGLLDVSNDALLPPP